MSVIEAVTQTVQTLSPEQQQQVLEYAQALHQKQAQASENTDVHSDSFLNHSAFGMWRNREDMKDVKLWRQRLWRSN